jgi:hypothetical protein
MQKLDSFTVAFFTAALWSSTDNSRDDGGDPLDKNYDISDIDAHCMQQLAEQCERFQAENAGILADSELDDDQAGHDFWLTRNGHGCGFWDRGLGPIGRKLTDACKLYKGVDLYVGDDGKIYASGYET